MKIEYEQGTIAEINDLVAAIRTEAITIKHGYAGDVDNISDYTFKISQLLQDGYFTGGAA